MASRGDNIVNGFRTIPEPDSISVTKENIAPLTLPAEIFSFAPTPDLIQCHFKNGDTERKVFCNIDLTDAEKVQLRSLQQEARAAKFDVLPSMASMATRFLSRARGDHKKAFKLMKETQAWRQEYFKKGPLSDKELAQDLQHGIIYFGGRDKDFRPVIIIRGNRIPEKWIKDKRTDLLIRVLVFCMEYLIRYMLVPGKVENLNVIFDFQGVSIGFSDISRLKEVYSVMSHHYLGRVFKFFICNLSPGLKALTGMATAFLTDRQKQKLCFVDDISELRKDFALHQLEEDLGGSRPVETKFYPFPLHGGPFEAGFKGGSNDESVVNGHLLLSARGTRGKLWDDELAREDNLALEYVDGALELFKKFDLPIPPECIKGRLMQAWYNVEPVGGVKGDRVCLSASKDGSKVDLAASDDGTGRQRWVMTPGDGDWYHIQVAGGLDRTGAYLSAHEDGSKVDLWDVDDGSGRQRWTLSKGDDGGSWYIVQVSGGTAKGRTYLSAHADGSRLDLWTADDGSGRQKWKLIPPRARQQEDHRIVSI